MSILKRTSAIIITAAVLLSLFIFSANAAKNGGKYENIKWSVNTKTGRLTISGKGQMSGFSVDEEEMDYDAAPWYSDYSDEIKSIVIKKGVTSIGHQAFKNLTNLKSVTMANSLKKIGPYAFYNCKKLKTIKFSNKLKTIESTAFFNCKSLKSVKLPKSVRTIGNYAFENCKKLKKITLPDSVNSIGHDAFIGTAYYKNSKNRKNGALYIGHHLIHVKKSVEGQVKVKKGTKTIAEWAMYDNNKITSVSIPESVRYLNTLFVCNCFGMEKFKVNENSKYFTSEDSVLFNKKKTKLVNYPAKKTSENYTIPETVTEIGGWAFDGCENLKSVTMGDKVRSIGEAAFEDCTNLSSLNIPADITELGSYAFMRCKSLDTEVVLNNIKEINAFAFCDCAEIKEATLSNTVKTIGDCAFGGCKKLMKITIPASVKDIDIDAFSDANEELTVYGDVNTEAQEASKFNKFKFIDIKTGTVYDYHNMKENPLNISADDQSVKLSALKKGNVVINPLKIEDAQGNTSVKLYFSDDDKALEKLVDYDKETGVITLKKSDKYKKGSYEICISVNAAGNMEYWDGYDDVYFTLTIK